MRELKFRAYHKMLKRYLEPNEFIESFCADANIIVELPTGLKDKNGMEIYDGDILQGLEGDNATVFWRTAEAEWGVRWSDNKAEYSLAESAYWDGLGNIIGNIHENHELLEDEE